MASIKLIGLETIKPQASQNDPNPRVVAENEFTYKDIRLDLRFETELSNVADGTSVTTSDLQDLRDQHDIKQALQNIFSTLPGQKVLNPYFGLNLAHYCFEPITAITADHLARSILIEAPQMDSRIDIKHLSVIGDIDLNHYDVDFVLILPKVASGLLNIKGILNSDGLTIT